MTQREREDKNPTISLVETKIDRARSKYDTTGELSDLAELRELIKEHRALRGIPYEAP